MARLAPVVHLVRCATGEAEESAVDEVSVETGVRLSLWFGREWIRVWRGS